MAHGDLHIITKNHPNARMPTMKSGFLSVKSALTCFGETSTIQKCFEDAELLVTWFCAGVVGGLEVGADFVEGEPAGFEFAAGVER